jgi:nucleoside-diphosphate-sugar epimerase
MAVIAVTGATGFLGSEVVVRLLADGHEVRGLDRRTEGSIHRSPQDGYEERTVDLRDNDATIAALTGCDGVVHLAGYPRAGDRTPADVFATNTSITFSVAEAAVAAGVSTFANVSSISVLGYPFFTHAIRPEYLPIDEKASTTPQDAYGLSKSVGEAIVTAAAGRSGGKLAAVSLRMPWLQSPQTFWEDIPASVDQGMDWRNLFAYLDIRDAAEAIAAVFRRDNSGHTRMLVASSDTFSERETSELIASRFPGTDMRKQLPGHDSLIDSSLARRYLDFTSTYSWRDYPRPTATR